MNRAPQCQSAMGSVPVVYKRGEGGVNSICAAAPCRVSLLKAKVVRLRLLSDDVYVWV